MSEKTIIKLNASSLPLLRCTLMWYRTVVQGYTGGIKSAKLVYGSAVHRYIDTMFKTEGNMRLAIESALAEFRVPKSDDRKSQHLSDEKHMLVTCFNLWDQSLSKEQDFDIIKLHTKCWYCKGTGVDDVDLDPAIIPPKVTPCKHCDKGIRLQAATEVTFELPYYEDDYIKVLLCGTIDKIGKIRNGCYAVGDYKTTSTWDADTHLNSFELGPQLRFYVFAVKLMAQLAPESALGQIGATQMGAFIDGIYLKPKASDNSYKRSIVFQFKQEEMDEFRLLLSKAISHISYVVQHDKWNIREGILNGSCDNKNKFGKCDYWFVCKAQSPEIGQILLDRDFQRKPYDPINHE